MSNPLKSQHIDLVEKFEMLIYDWILSSQTYMWSLKQSTELELFNKVLKKFKKAAIRYPQLNCKMKMYETVIMFTSNRNPISLLNPSNSSLSNEICYSKTNQNVHYSISSILKKFQLQIVE
jgi:hypothetical protein